MLERELIFELIKKSDLDKYAHANDQNSAFIIKKQIDSIMLEVTIPLNCFEFFFDAIDLQSNIKISDWDECYGDDQVNEYKDELEKILRITNEGKIKFSDNNKTVEYEDRGQYKYFFGDFDKKYWQKDNDKI